jgi:hypothetical protein
MLSIAVAQAFSCMCLSLAVLRSCFSSLSGSAVSLCLSDHARYRATSRFRACGPRRSAFKKNRATQKASRFNPVIVSGEIEARCSTFYIVGNLLILVRA